MVQVDYCARCKWTHGQIRVIQYELFEVRGLVSWLEMKVTTHWVYITQYCRNRYV